MITGGEHTGGAQKNQNTDRRKKKRPRPFNKPRGSMSTRKATGGAIRKMKQEWVGKKSDRESERDYL